MAKNYKVGGPTLFDRQKARRAAEAGMAKAQAARPNRAYQSTTRLCRGGE